MNVEVDFPLGRESDLRGLVFFDAGGVFGGLSTVEDVTIVDGRFDFRRIRASVGVGVRWLVPPGPIRLELGVPLWRDPLRIEPAVVFDFIFGYNL